MISAIALWPSTVYELFISGLGTSIDKLYSKLGKLRGPPRFLSNCNQLTPAVENRASTTVEEGSIIKEDEILCPSRYIIYQWFGDTSHPSREE